MGVNGGDLFVVADHDEPAVTADLAARIDDRAFLGGEDGGAGLRAQVDAFMEVAAALSVLGGDLNRAKRPVELGAGDLDGAFALARGLPRRGRAVGAREGVGLARVVGARDALKQAL